MQVLTVFSKPVFSEPIYSYHTARKYHNYYAECYILKSRLALVQGHFHNSAMSLCMVYTYIHDLQ